MQSVQEPVEDELRSFVTLLRDVGFDFEHGTSCCG